MPVTRRAASRTVANASGIRSSSSSPSARRCRNSAVMPLQLGVAHRDEVVLDGVDGLRDGLELAQDLALTDTEELVKNGRHGGGTPWFD